MKLREKFAPYVYCFMGSGMLTNTHDEEVIEHFAKKCEKVCDEFSKDFIDWVMKKMSSPAFPSYTNQELLDLYKKEHNL